MQSSSERILTTHVGSLARPHDLLEVMREKEHGRPYDPARFTEMVTEAVRDVVRRQAEEESSRKQKEEAVRAAELEERRNLLEEIQLLQEEKQRTASMLRAKETKISDLEMRLGELERSIAAQKK